AGELLPIPPDRLAGLASYVGKPLVVGLRAEAVGVASPDASGPGLAMDVILVEPVGQRNLVTMERSGRKIAAWMGEGRTVAAGERVKAVIDMNQAHYFDAA